jgi:hypothetical protein
MMQGNRAAVIIVSIGVLKGVKVMATAVAASATASPQVSKAVQTNVLHKALACICCAMAFMPVWCVADSIGEVVPANLYGSWTSRMDCSNPDFVFQANTVEYSYDADGRREHYRFGHPSYESQGHREILVDVHEPHGLSGTTSDTGFVVHVLDVDHLAILRGGKKKVANIDLSRCKDR